MFPSLCIANTGNTKELRQPATCGYTASYDARSHAYIPPRDIHAGGKTKYVGKIETIQPNGTRVLAHSAEELPPQAGYTLRSSTISHATGTRQWRVPLSTIDLQWPERGVMALDGDNRHTFHSFVEGQNLVLDFVGEDVAKPSSGEDDPYLLLLRVRGSTMGREKPSRGEMFAIEPTGGTAMGVLTQDVSASARISGLKNVEIFPCSGMVTLTSPDDGSEEDLGYTMDAAGTTMVLAEERTLAKGTLVRYRMAAASSAQQSAPITGTVVRAECDSMAGESVIYTCPTTGLAYAAVVGRDTAEPSSSSTIAGRAHGRMVIEVEPIDDWMIQDMFKLSSRTFAFQSDQAHGAAYDAYKLAYQHASRRSTIHRDEIRRRLEVDAAHVIPLTSARKRVAIMLAPESPIDLPGDGGAMMTLQERFAGCHVRTASRHCPARSIAGVDSPVYGVSVGLSENAFGSGSKDYTAPNGSFSWDSVPIFNVDADDNVAVPEVAIKMKHVLNTLDARGILGYSDVADGENQHLFSLAEDANPYQTTLRVSGLSNYTNGVACAGVVRIGDELMYYGEVNVSGGELRRVRRGILGTVPTAHRIGWNPSGAFTISDGYKTESVSVTATSGSISKLSQVDNNDGWKFSDEGSDRTLSISDGYHVKHLSGVSGNGTRIATGSAISVTKPNAKVLLLNTGVLSHLYMHSERRRKLSQKLGLPSESYAKHASGQKDHNGFARVDEPKSREGFCNRMIGSTSAIPLCIKRLRTKKGDSSVENRVVHSVVSAKWDITAYMAMVVAIALGSSIAAGIILAKIVAISGAANPVLLALLLAAILILSTIATIYIERANKNPVWLIKFSARDFFDSPEKLSEEEAKTKAFEPMRRAIRELRSKGGIIDMMVPRPLEDCVIDAEHYVLARLPSGTGPTMGWDGTSFREWEYRGLVMGLSGTLNRVIMDEAQNWHELPGMTMAGGKIEGPSIAMMAKAQGDLTINYNASVNTMRNVTMMD